MLARIYAHEYVRPFVPQHIHGACCRFPFSVGRVRFTCSRLLQPQASLCRFSTSLTAWWVFHFLDLVATVSSYQRKKLLLLPVRENSHCWWLSRFSLSLKNSITKVVATFGKWASRGKSKIQQRAAGKDRDLIQLWGDGSLMYINALCWWRKDSCCMERSSLLP